MNQALGCLSALISLRVRAEESQSLGARRRGVRGLQSIHSGERHLKRKLEDAAAANLGIIQRHRAQAARKKDRKRKRTGHVKQAAKQAHILQRKQNKARNKLTLLTWNTRGWGARFSEIDQAIKSRCILQFMQHRGVGLAILTDLKFREVGVRTYKTEAQTWTLVVAGAVGFLLNERWAAWWEAGGSKFGMASAQGNEKIRAASITFPRQGWRRGMHVVGVYAPTSAARKRQRDECMRQVQQMLEEAPAATSLRVLAGDFNAELGLAGDGAWSDVLGPHGYVKRSVAGKEWLTWCRHEGWLEAASQFHQPCRGTWWHCGYNTEHILDHFFLPQAERWHITACRVIHGGHERRPTRKRVPWQWGPYTDHHPVELTLRQGKLWVPAAPSRRGEVRADVSKLNGMGSAVATYRKRFAEAVDEKLRAQGEGLADMGWVDVVRTCQESAMEVLGRAIKHPTRPWLEGHEEELRQLDAAITEARRRDREARAYCRPWTMEQMNQAMTTRRDLNASGRDRRRKVGEWETRYWTDLASRALQADQDRDVGELFRLHRLLGAHKEVKRRDGGAARPADFEAEREAWKEHFRRIQAGSGSVPESVWANVTAGRGVARWLEATPTREEFERVVRQLQNRRAAGEDGFMAEYLKYGGDRIQETVFQVLLRAWDMALHAREDLEAEAWPPEWRVGLVVPLWKRKGDKADKNTWRGVTLLSVGTKVMARLVTNRLARWSDTWLHEAQAGFRAGRGVDDAQQVSRRVAEEIARCNSDEVVLLRLFDIEKAYPRVCRPAMWRVLERRGCPEGMIKVLKAIHNHTNMKVRVHDGCSSVYVPERGLREGCPSSPVLFNIYHDAVMEDFRVRRAAAAQEVGQLPGLEWEYKVDGRLRKRHTVRQQAGHATQVDVIGDFVYADDTGIVGVAEEAAGAEKLFGQVLRDWEEKLHPDKTEGLRLSGSARQLTDVRGQGEASCVRHVGAWVAESGRTVDETAKRRSTIALKTTAVAKSWTFGGSRTRREQCNMKRSVRLTIMKAVVIPTALSTARTRAWDSMHITRIEQLVLASVRRCFGVKYQRLHDLHISNEMLRKAAGWPKVKHMVMRASLTWLGHVARMNIRRRPKQMLFGWWRGRGTKYNT